MLHAQEIAEVAREWDLARGARGRAAPRASTRAAVRAAYAEARGDASCRGRYRRVRARPTRPMEVADSILDLVGNTPLVRLRRVSGPRTCECTLLAKVETVNPGGSVKDRVAVAMIDAAERDGLLQPGGTIVEPTSGNTGAGLAIVAAQRGYRCIFVMSDKMSDEKVALLRVVRRRGRGVPDRGAARGPALVLLDRRAARARDARRVPARSVLQRGEPARARAHDRARDLASRRAGGSRTSSPGVGTGGTITGVGRCLKAQNPGGADRRRRSRRARCTPAVPAVRTWSKESARTSGPTTFDRDVVDRVVEVSDADSFLTARRVTREEGLLIGGSGGTAVHAALDVARPLGPDAVVVVLLPDSGRSYLSKIFDDQWMYDMGFLRGDGPSPATCSRRRASADCPTSCSCSRRSRCATRSP